MVPIQQRLLMRCGLLAVALVAPVAARKFYDDDPLWKEPPPIRVEKMQKRDINEYFDFFQDTFFEPGKQERKQHRILPAQDVNTLGEVWESGWFENRYPTRPMSLEELVRGPGNDHVPSMDGPWKVISGKNEGITPGLLIEDSKGQKFFLKFDPIRNPELASAADVIGSKFFYDLGYNVPENHIVRFDRQQLKLTSKSSIKDHQGHQRPMKERDIRDVLAKTPRDPEGRYRALASFFIPGNIIGPFRYYGVRSDDPNDGIPHQNRRELRGLYVFSAWLNHTDTKSINSLDSVVQENGLRYVRHYLIDFGAILGSDSFEAKSPRAGNVYLFDFKPAAIQFLTLGLYVPRWQTAEFPDLPSVGHFESEVFDPEHWKNNYPNPAFDHRLPDDCFWAAKKLMAFTDEQIRAIVQTGEYSDPRAVDWITRVLIARRDKLGRAYFDDVLPLDRFRVRNGRLVFEDLALKYNFAGPRQFQAEWSRFDNESERKTPYSSDRGFALPAGLAEAAEGAYFAVDIRGDDPRKTVTVYLRKKAGELQVIGVERRW